jgi:LacI family transcriptional regulator, repressor for deo operon, udp, cdd, tsx, nupC, and nupG
VPGRRGPQDARSAPTIYDVARESGVAASTLSRAFSRPGRVNSETAARIHATAERLGYRANPIARALPTGKTAMIAVVVSDVTNPVYFQIIRGTEAAAAEACYTIVLADSQESGLIERSSVERAISAVEGVVLTSSRMSDSAIQAAPHRGSQPGLPAGAAHRAQLNRSAQPEEILAGPGHYEGVEVSGPRLRVDLCRVQVV